MSRKPLVVISPVLAPFSSRMAFEATVVACSTFLDAGAVVAAFLEHLG